LGINKEISIPNSKVTIEFENISEDSRCPANVTCVWEGIAIVNLKAVSGSETKDIRLQQRFLPKQVTKSFSYSGFRFTLQDMNLILAEKKKHLL
jgi:hypothetical protein